PRWTSSSSLGRLHRASQTRHECYQGVVPAGGGTRSGVPEGLSHGAGLRPRAPGFRAERTSGDNAPWARSLGGRALFSGIGRGERAVLNEAADDIASLQSWIASMSGRIDEQAKAIAQLQSALGAVMDVLIESGGGAVDGDMLRHRVEEAIDAFQSRPAQRP